jgi:hypothetical protein
LSRASAGAFLLAVFSFPQRTSASDVSIYTVAKGIYYEQTSAAMPVALAENGYIFAANVALTAPGAVASAFVQAPGGTNQALSVEGDDEFEFRKKYNTKAKLDSNYPNGSFVLTLNTVHDGSRSIALAVSGDGYPGAPRIGNFPEAQQVNANGYFLVHWDRMAGGTASDFIQLRIEDSEGDKIFETPDFGKAGALNGEGASALITPGTLKPNTVYEATLLFQKNVTLNQGAYPGALGAANYFGRTTFRLATSAAGEPDVASYELMKGRTFLQADAGTPSPDADKPFEISAKAAGSAAGRIANAVLRTPTGSSLPLLAESDGEDFEYSDVANSDALLDSNYPAGDYTLSLNTIHDGTRSPSLYLPATTFPPVPHLNNFNPAAEIRAYQDLSLRWDSWPGGTENDFIQLRIEDKDGDKIFETPDLGDEDAVNGRATGIVVPAGTLIPGKSYRGRLTFQKIAGIDTGGYPGALGVVSFFSKTKFDIETAPPDIKTVSVFKGHDFIQRDTGSPTLHTSTAFVFTASVEAEASGTVSSAIVITPNGAAVPLQLQADGETFILFDGCTEQAMVDAAYPEGTYRLQINTAHDGTVTIPVTISGATYPNAPRLQNFPSTQMVDVLSPLVLSWDAFAGGTATDFISLAIGDAAGTWFATKSYGKSSALNGTATATTVPASVLVENHLYKGRLLFQKMLVADNSVYPGAEALAGYFARTQFTLTTAGPDNPPRLTSAQLSASGQMKFTLRALTGGEYRIHWSTNLSQWFPLTTISTSRNETEFSDSTAGTCLLLLSGRVRAVGGAWAVLSPAPSIGKSSRVLKTELLANFREANRRVGSGRFRRGSGEVWDGRWPRSCGAPGDSCLR